MGEKQVVLANGARTSGDDCTKRKEPSIRKDVRRRALREGAPIVRLRLCKERPLRFGGTNRRLLPALRCAALLFAAAAIAHAADAGAQPLLDSVATTQPNGGDYEALDEPSASVAFRKDLAATLRRRCLGCHRTGGVAGLAFDAPAAVVELAAQMRDAVASGRMPPWQPLGAPGEFSNDRALKPRERRVFDDWADIVASSRESAEELTGAIDSLAANADARHWRLGRPDVVESIEARTRVVDDAGYLYADVELKDKRARRLRGIELRAVSGAPWQNAWLVLDSPATRSPADASTTSAESSGGWLRESLTRSVATRLLWTKRPGEGRPLQERAARLLVTRDVQPLALLSADQPYATTPPWAAWELPVGSRLAIAWRPALATRTAIDGQELEVALHYATDDTPRRPWTVTLSGVPRIDVAGRATRDEFTTPVPVEALSIAVHGSWRVRETHVDVTSSSGKTESLLWIGRYDPRWETSYVYFRPKRLGAGDRIEFRAQESHAREAGREQSLRDGFPAPLGQSFACVTFVCKRAEDESALVRALFGKRLDAGRLDR